MPSGEGTIVRLTVAGKLGSTAAGFQNSHNITIADEFFSGVSGTLSTGREEAAQGPQPQTTIGTGTSPKEPAEQPQAASPQEAASAPYEDVNPSESLMSDVSSPSTVTSATDAQEGVQPKTQGIWSQRKAQIIIAAISVAVVILCATIAGIVSNNIRGQKRLEVVKKVITACNKDNKIKELSTGKYSTNPALQFVWKGRNENILAACIVSNTGMSDSIYDELVDTHSSKDNSNAAWGDWKASWIVNNDTEAATITIQYIGNNYDTFSIKHTISDWKTSDENTEDETTSANEESGSNSDGSFTINLDCSVRSSEINNSTEEKINSVTSQNYRDTVWKTGKLVGCSPADKDSDATGIKGAKDEEALQTAFGNDYNNYQYYLGSLYGICASTDPYGLNQQIMNEKDAKSVQGALILCPDHPRAEEMRQKAQNDLDHWSNIATKRQQGLIKDDGTYKVPSEMSTGTWKTMSEKVTNCYWEMQDANGQIYDNNFVSAGIAQTITIPNGVAGFSSQGCGAWEKQ